MRPWVFGVFDLGYAIGEALSFLYAFLFSLIVLSALSEPHPAAPAASYLVGHIQLGWPEEG